MMPALHHDARCSTCASSSATPLMRDEWVTLVLGGVITGLTVVAHRRNLSCAAPCRSRSRASPARAVAIVLTCAGVRGHAFHRALSRRDGRRECRQRHRHAGVTRWRISRSRCTFIDAFLCLLGGRRAVRHGARATPATSPRAIGLHAGWVAVIYVVRETSTRDWTQPAAPGCSATSTASSAGWCSPGRWCIGVALCCWYRPE